MIILPCLTAGLRNPSKTAHLNGVKVLIALSGLKVFIGESVCMKTFYFNQFTRCFLGVSFIIGKLDLVSCWY